VDLCEEYLVDMSLTEFFRKRDTFMSAQINFSLGVLLNFNDYQQRRRRARKAERFDTSFEVSNLNKFGFFRKESTLNGRFKDTVRAGNKEIECVLRSSLYKGVGGFEIDVSYDYSPHKPLIDFILDPYVISVVSSYLGYVPICRRASLIYSPPFDTPGLELLDTTQYYHLDHECKSIVRVFLPLNDLLDESYGPLHVIEKSYTKEIYRAIKANTGIRQRNIGALKNRKAFSIAELISFGAPIEETALVGKVEDVIFADTCRCYHRRGNNKGNPRKVLMVQYTSPYAISFPLRGQRYSPRFSGESDAESIEKYVFGKSYYTWDKYGLVSYEINETSEMQVPQIRSFS